LRVGGLEWVSEDGGGAIDAGDPTVLAFYTGTGDANTRGVINLPAGEVDLEFIWFEDGGGASVELYAAKGAYTCDVDTPNWRLVGTVVSPGATVAIPGVSADGWTVEYSAPGGDQVTLIAGAEAELAGAASVSGVAKIQYADPEAAGGTKACYLPFPNDTAADDNDFAIRGTAQLVIPATGTYHFGFQGDDGGYLQIEGQTWDSIVATANADYGVINGDRIEFDVNTGNSYTVGAITLAEGTYTIRTVFWERGGGGFHWVFGGPPSSPLYAPIMADAAGVIPEPAMPFVGGALPPAFTNASLNPDGTITVEWVGGELQMTDSLTPPIQWMPSGETSPYTFTPDPAQPRLFGRIVGP
jgi:hypothetical protein